MAVESKLKDKLRAVAETGGNFALGSGVPLVETAAPVAAPVSGPITAPVPKAANADPLMQQATVTGGQEIAKAVTAAGDSATGNMVPTPEDLFTAEKVELSEDEREAFLDALLAGTRYEQRFSIFNDRIRGKLRCRSTEESEAIAAWMSIGIREARYKTAMDYSIDLRNILLATQIAELNGVKYPLLKAPLWRTQEGETTVEPGWLASAEGWSLNSDGKRSEAIVAGVYEELRVFERKYWTMVVHARDQNFWHPAKPT